MTHANHTQQYGRVAYGGRKTRLKVTNDANDTQERGGIAHGGRTTRPKVTTDAITDTTTRDKIGRASCP